MKVSTVLLLVIIGFFIYCLMKPSNEEGFAETNVTMPTQQPMIENDNLVSPDVIDQVLNDTQSNDAVEGADLIEGVDFDQAFDKPLSELTDTTTVDLNKNNVKNYDAKDYLPKESRDDWFNTDFSQAKYKLNDDKLINTEKYVIGVNTVGQSLKNASYDIRGAVNVPKYSVSPWQNSTIEPDYNIKPLC